MKLYLILFCVLVGFLNVMMHVFVGKASKANPVFLDSIWSGNFLLALLSGFISIFVILYIYHSEMNVAQGIIVMGASSIIVGVILTVVFMGKELNLFDWLLFLAVVVFYIIKLLRG